MLPVIDSLTSQFAGLTIEAQALISILAFIGSIAVIEQLVSLGLRTIMVILLIITVLGGGAAAITIGYRLLALTLVIL